VFLSDDQVRHLRFSAQLLARAAPSAATPAEAVRATCGIQAQDLHAAELAIRPRAPGSVTADVTRARVEEHSIVRTWAMRGTLHLLAAEDARWILGVVGPPMIRAGRRRREQLGLDEDTYHYAIGVLRTVLMHGPLTRAEIVERLAGSGIALEGQARPHLLMRAALEGLICYGPDRGSEPAYAPFEDWVTGGAPMPREAALGQLARRYIQAYGPAGSDDFAAWSGLSAAEARFAWRTVTEEALEVETGTGPAWVSDASLAWLDEAPAAPAVRLLPAFDTYLLGYRQRTLSVAPEVAARVNAGGGIIHPTLAVDGRVAVRSKPS
jgi:hypothetical protein